MVFKYSCTLLFMVMVTAVLTEESTKANETSNTDTETIGEKNKIKNEIYLKEGLELLCGNGSAAVHVAAEPKPGWFCQSGYARNTDGKCIKLDQCNSKLF